MQKLLEYYEHFIEDSKDNIEYVFNYPAEHAMITDDYGNACGHLGTPFINNCGYSAPFNILKHIYGNISYASSSAANQSNLQEFDQKKYFVFAHLVSMDDTGYLYVPSGCRESFKKCRLHIAFHGCKQGRSFVKTAFAELAGYNQIAEVNDIVVLYPQAYPSELGALTGGDIHHQLMLPDLASRLGFQMAGVKAMLDHLID
eukprot:m.174202 g.174202  ORF g.174202 m.174202 type:complete len:201 (+) comp39106_c1_seq23:464-1066(+)